MPATEADTQEASTTIEEADRRRSVEGSAETPTMGTPLLTIAEVAERLGVQVRHVRRLVHERRIPYIKWGRLLRFDPAEIEKWIDECRHSGQAVRPDG